MPIFNVDFYLDVADQSNCVWGMPGSNQWSVADADAEIARRNRDGGFDSSGSGAVPIPMQPGDVLLHDITALHGSPSAQSRLRRVLYYEFRPADVLIGSKSHNAAYCRAKQRMLASVIAERAAALGEPATPYAPTVPEPLPQLPTGWQPATWLYPHEDFRG